MQGLFQRAQLGSRESKMDSRQLELGSRFNEEFLGVLN